MRFRNVLMEDKNMDRAEFLKNLFLMYPQNFNEFNMLIWREKYESILPENIDYDTLDRILMKHHNSVTTAPTPKDLREIASSQNLIYRTSQTNNFMPSNPAPPPPEFYEAKERLMKKLGKAG